MKKWLCVLSLLFAVSFVFSTFSVAENVNVLASFSTDELLQLKTMIEVELASRKDLDHAVSVPSGIYTVGVDIPVGVFTIIAEETASSVRIRDANGKQLLYETLYKDQQLGRTDLLYGYKVEITGESVKFTKYKGLGF